MSATFAIVVTFAPAVAGLHMSTVLVLYFQSEPSSACPREPSWSKHPLDGAPKNVFSYSWSSSWRRRSSPPRKRNSSSGETGYPLAEKFFPSQKKQIFCFRRRSSAFSLKKRVFLLHKKISFQMKNTCLGEEICIRSEDCNRHQPEAQNNPKQLRTNPSCYDNCFCKLL